MINLSKTKDQLNKLTNHLSLGILGTVAAIVPQNAESQDRQIEEVVVSATKKDESASDVPLTVTALTEETLREMNVSNFDEYIEYLPNVTSGGRGPGQSTIFIRGLAVDPVNVFLSAAQGSSPNVALYLDEQPVQVPGRNLDVYVADMERIEVLPGPQGTLFGASSQAGTVRLITNKPNFEVQEGGFNASLFNTQKGSMSSSFDAFLNVPVSDTWAIRGVLYNSNSGGYIDNVSGTWNSKGKGSFDGYGKVDPATGTQYTDSDNTNLVKEDFNEATYEGFRISSAHNINDDWDMLITHMDQTIQADGVWDYDPAVGDLQVQRFSPDSLEDTFSQTSLTLEGRMGKLDVVYTGSILDRKAEQTVDYSGYVNAGAYMPYYTCNYTSSANATICGSGVVDLYLLDDNERTTHEFRVSSNELSELPFSYTAGVFIEESILKTQNDYGYNGFLEAYPAVGPNTVVPNVYHSNPMPRDPQYRFFNDLKRTDEQTAFFAELTFPLTEKLDILFGARQYDLDIDYVGQSKFGGLAEGDSGRDYNSSGGHTDQPLNMSDTITKFTASYKVDEDTLIYFTQSEGYRPGGYNRGGGLTNSCAKLDSDAEGYCGEGSGDNFRANPTTTFESDEVLNTEIGIKTILADGTVRLNATYYNVEWTDIQVSQFDPANISILTFVENAADADISGFEADLLWYPTDRLTIAAAISLNDTEITNDVSKTVPIVDIGSALPLSPERQYNIRIRRDGTFKGMDSYTQVAYKSATDTYNSFESAKVLGQPEYHVLDMAFGFTVNETDVEFFIRNATDERANLYYNDQDDIPRITTNRPRNMGVRIARKF
ncbi:TonB-dependent receptor plug domain-containing protein [Gammaproteobacteria bacterium]|nr:TonB-dependent receptor plug domain-containing protein [Gammaproteobacteria bacterium]MDC1074363.1 TonB-dependent receptor plug domain-containing protein [Gammaproteobacteria bacterium]